MLYVNVRTCHPACMLALQIHCATVVRQLCCRDLSLLNDHCSRLLLLLLLLCCLQPVWRQLQQLIDSVPSNAGWMKRLEQQQQQATDTAQEAQQIMNHYMDHALDVMMFCSGNAAALQAARDMIEIGRKVLSGPAAGEGFSAVVQQFDELHKQVQKFCSTAAADSSSSEVLDGLQCMRDTVCPCQV